MDQRVPQDHEEQMERRPRRVQLAQLELQALLDFKPLLVQQALFCFSMEEE